ncbi:MAG: glycosyltransferase [Deltaproteobacteria bacterium]|nr:glycosyltransferase [Deltaproteobacteria bacterium]
MHVLICNERFLFRFGVDRVLIILGRGLKERGHTVSIMANRFDREVVESFASRIIEVPTGADDYINLNEYTADWLEQTWSSHFPPDEAPDVVLIAGWPFFMAIPVLKKVCPTVVFIDCGAVPLDGYSGGALVTQEKLRDLRKGYLDKASCLVGISDFISTSQSKIDSQGKVPVKSILLGADHMEMSIWSSNQPLSERPQGNAIEILDALQQKDMKTILCLGRWEPFCYKNSEAAFDLMAGLSKSIPNCALLVMANDSEVAVPPGLAHLIFPIGFPSDEELVAIMSRVDLGVSFSLWEGFNLPLAEMQWLNRPALVFDLGAHPEVISHPWYLCHDMAEMAAKVWDVLTGDGPDPEVIFQASERFHAFFRWDRFIEQYIDLFSELLAGQFRLVLDVTNSTRDPANSGVIRITRRLGRELQRYLDPVFVVWDEEKKCYVLPTGPEFNQLGQYNGPVLSDAKSLSPDNGRRTLTSYIDSLENKPGWLLFTETMIETRAREIRRYAKNNGLNLAAVFHDSIPVLRPDLCNEDICKNHSDYMVGLAECDLVIPVSSFSAGCLTEFWKNKGINQSVVVANANPGEFGGYERNRSLQEPPAGTINILCVSTLEPRKNHLKLLQACLLIQESHPELDWTLTLVGNKYAGAFDLADSIQSICSNNPRINWLGIVDDDTLHRLYLDATFTVYPSCIEGFGMPIMESLWHGRPCICYENGVMMELAAEGGCLTANVMDEQSLAAAIYRLSVNKELLTRLSREAVSRRIKTWKEHAQEFISMLSSRIKSKTNTETTVKPLPPFTFTGNDFPNWEEILYPQSICYNWQMNDSERLALTALLARHRPQCSIEVGTYMGGSLSLISQYSDIVFSVDMDPSITAKANQFKNVSFLTGRSALILPILFKKLDKYNIPLDFILIDGDHSANGIRDDINCLLSYIPKKPFFCMMHDSFNPECRKGMLSGDWTSSPYVHWIDIDFIPGRIIENPGPTQGEMWGGFGLAYFTPTPRSGDLQVRCSAEMMFQKMK